VAHAHVVKAATLAADRQRPLERVALYGVPIAMCLWWFGPVLYRMTDLGDFPGHIRFAQAMAATGRVTIPHFGYELAMIAVHALRPGAGWNSAAYVVTMSGQLATVALLAHRMAASVPRWSPGARIGLAALAAVALLLVQPALPLGAGRDPWLFGYFPPNQYHNPTTLLSKPLALALFAAGAAAVSGAPAGRLWGWLALVVASGIVKPSFLLAFLPAVGLMALWHARAARWRLLIAGLFVPSVLLLLAQYALRYRLQADDGVSVTVAPLMVIGLYAPTDALTLVTRLALSVLFPLSVVAAFPQEAARDIRLPLAWLTFALGIVPGYLLAEAGGKASAGDFLWSGQLACFVLFAVSAAFLAARLGDAVERPFRAGTLARAAACGAVLAWHAVSGVQHLQRSWLA